MSLYSRVAGDVVRVNGTPLAKNEWEEFGVADKH